MPLTPKQLPKQPLITKKAAADSINNALHHLAFDNTVQANIISTITSGKIVTVNSAAAKLLGYSKKELLTKTRGTIFAINESSFRKMLQQRSAEGYSVALVTAIKKNGKSFPCEITSTVFADEAGVEQSITSITDISERISIQKNIDADKEKIVADNIALVELKQKAIDIKKEKAVADDIILANSKQQNIDAKKEKIVADDIAMVKSQQKKIDIKKEKIVADNIVLAKSKQKIIDVKKEKIVADNIILAQEKSDARIIDNNEWIKYIAKTSYDIMWDWDIISGEIYVGDSIEELFGYKLENDTTSFLDFTACLISGEKKAVEKKLLKALSSGAKTWKDSYMVKRYDGSIASTTSRASIVRDENGKAIRLIGATQDVSKMQELEQKVEEQDNIKKEYSEIFQMAAKLSYDGIWDWNMETNDFFLGEGFEELFGYGKQNTKGTMADWSRHLHPEDKEAVEKGLADAIASDVSNWEHAYRFIRADGSVADVFGRASIIRYADGKAYRMIGAIHDISRQKELEEKLDHEIASKGKMLTEYENNFKLILNSSSDILYDIDLASDEVILSDAYEKEFGYIIHNNRTTTKEMFSHIHPEDKEALIQDYNKVHTTEDVTWKYTFRFLKADDSVTNLFTSGIILRHLDGKAYRRIGYLQDQSRQINLEERLEQEIKLKEKQISEATEDAKDTERSDIGKELHDNINQLLGASRMYLEMAKRGGPNSSIYLSRSSEYTLTAIEEIRKLTKGLTTDIIKNLGLCEAIDKIIHDIMEANQVKISCRTDGFIENSVSDKFKLNIYRIVQEQLNNILKHAKASEVNISLLQNKGSIILAIADDGVGFDTKKRQTGIGLTNIKSRAVSYNGKAEFISQPDHGCVLNVKFPLPGDVSMVN